MSNNKKIELKEVFTMWLKESAKGTIYLSGKSATGTKLVGFVNSKKDEPNQPDMNIMVQKGEGEKNEKYCNLWVNVSESGIKYISGKIGNDRIVGFFREGAELGSKKPFFTVYFSQDNQEKPESKPVSKPVSKPETKIPF